MKNRKLEVLEKTAEEISGETGNKVSLSKNIAIFTIAW